MAILVKTNWNIEKRLKDIDVTLIYYNKLKKFIKAIKKLTKHCEIATNLKEQIYKIYLDNQVLIKIIKEIKLTLKLNIIKIYTKRVQDSSMLQNNIKIILNIKTQKHKK